MIQERQQVKGQQSCISIFVAYPTISSSNLEHQPRNDNSIQIHGSMVDLYRATSGERNFIEQIKAQFFLEAVLTTEIMLRAPIRFRKESLPQHFKI